ncbi:hypothetical protein P3S67_032460 [Capsicum chacoense]
MANNKCLSHKLSFFFCLLLVSLVVNSFWSSNTQVMAFRSLPYLEEEIQMIEQLLKPYNYKSSCGKSCTSHQYCQAFKGSPCTQCRLQYKTSKVWKCWHWR